MIEIRFKTYEIDDGLMNGVGGITAEQGLEGLDQVVEAELPDHEFHVIGSAVDLKIELKTIFSLHQKK